MEFGDNLLSHDAARYTLYNATINNGILHMNPSSHVLYNITTDDIVAATEYFRVSLLYDTPTNNYSPHIRVHIHLELIEEGVVYDQTLFPTEFPNNLFYQELKLDSGEYRSFTFEIFSEESITFNLWELCPEAADEDIQTIIDGVEQSLPRLLFDYNTWPLTIVQEEATVALITFRLLDATDLQGHFEMTFTASEECTLTLRFKDNTSTELFSPILYDLSAGRNSVGVPHAYLDRLAGVHTCNVTAQVTGGTLYVDTRGILFTIDGGYLAERILDIGVDMRDISLRQLSEDYGPDEIWIVGIEAGEALIRKRPYSPRATISFEPQYSLGRALTAAIEFDGVFLLRASAENYTIETEEYPWVFWIDASYILWGQKGTDETTRIQLDSGVSTVAACRGYKSEIYKTHDQGLVVVYIKGSTVKYRQFKYFENYDNYLWDIPYTLDETITTAVNATVDRINDYRLGITVETTTDVKTYITERTYVNQAAPPENVFLSSPSIVPFAYLPVDYDTSLNIVEQTLSDDRLTLSITYDAILELRGYSSILDYLTFNDSIPQYHPDTGEQFIKEVLLEVDRNVKTSTVIISLNFRPLKLITEVTINKVGNFAILQKYDQWGYGVCPAVTASFDTTNYMTAPTQKEYASLTVPQTTVNYLARNDIYNNPQETPTLSVPTTTIRYNKVNDITNIATEVPTLVVPITTFVYTQTSITPI